MAVDDSGIAMVSWEEVKRQLLHEGKCTKPRVVSCHGRLEPGLRGLASIIIYQRIKCAEHKTRYVLDSRTKTYAPGFRESDRWIASSIAMRHACPALPASLLQQQSR